MFSCPRHFCVQREEMSVISEFAMKDHRKVAAHSLFDPSSPFHFLK